MGKIQSMLSEVILLFSLVQCKLVQFWTLTHSQNLHYILNYSISNIWIEPIYIVKAFRKKWVLPIGGPQYLGPRIKFNSMYRRIFIWNEEQVPCIPFRQPDAAYQIEH